MKVVDINPVSPLDIDSLGSLVLVVVSFSCSRFSSSASAMSAQEVLTNSLSASLVVSDAFPRTTLRCLDRCLRERCDFLRFVGLLRPRGCTGGGVATVSSSESSSESETSSGKELYESGSLEVP